MASAIPNLATQVEVDLQRAYAGVSAYPRLDSRGVTIPAGQPLSRMPAVGLELLYIDAAGLEWPAKIVSFTNTEDINAAVFGAVYQYIQSLKITDFRTPGSLYWP